MKQYIAIILLILICIGSNACPVCNSATGKQVRASLFGPDLGFHLAITIIPFAIFAFIVVLIYTGGRLSLRKKIKTV